MNEEDFKRKLESILESLYRIDREVEEYFKGKNADVKNGGYWRQSYSEDSSVTSYKKYNLK